MKTSKDELKERDRIRHRIEYGANPEKQRQRKRKYYRENKEKELDRIIAYSKNNPDINHKAVSKYQQDNPEKYQAHKLARSIQLKETCEMCGGVAVLRHHPDYTKPLEVRHLCNNCHVSIHLKYPIQPRRCYAIR